MTSSSPLQIEFIIKAMLDEKKRFYIIAQQISGNRACIYALDFGNSNIRKTLSCSGDTKKSQLGGLGWDKVRFKVLDFFKLHILTFFIHPASFTLVRYDKVLESKEAK